MVLLLLRFFVVVGLLVLPVYALACFALSFRHRLPNIDFAWIVRTGFSAANFAPRGQVLRRRAVLSLLTWAGLVLFARFVLVPALPKTSPEVSPSADAPAAAS